MVIFRFEVALGLLLISGILFSCKGASVRLFTEADFRGAEFKFNSSQTCTSLPTNFKGSIKTTGCIVVYKSGNCSREERNTDTRFYFRGDGYVVKSEESHLSEINYIIPPEEFQVNSIKDCEDTETNPTADFDFYEDYVFRQKMVQVRDICSCSNLPTSTFRDTWFRSANTYGNCFRIYNTTDCGGQPFFTTSVKWIDHLRIQFLSIEPCTLRRHCVKRLDKMAAKIISLQPVPNVPNISDFTQRHAITTKKKIVNNVTTHQEDNYEGIGKMKDTAQFQFSKEMSQFTTLQFKNDLKHGLQISNPFISNVWKELQIEFSKKFKSQLDSLIFETERETEYRIQRKIIVAPCTKYEVNSYVDVAQNVDVNYVVQLEVTGWLDDEQVDAEVIQRILKDMNMTVVENIDNFTVIAETTAKLTLTTVLSSGVDSSQSLITDCMYNFIKFEGSVVQLEELFNNHSNPALAGERVTIAQRVAFINNSTTQQEDIYEESTEVTDTASFEFPKQFYKISLLKIEQRARRKLEKSVPFLANVWAQLKSGLSANRSNWNETVSYGVENTKELGFQKTVVQSPCMRYEVSSFIEMKEDVEINYRVLLEVTAKLGTDPVRADEIRNNLKDINFLHDKDDFTSLVETTMKIKLNYGHGSGVDVAGTQMLDCLEEQAALVANCKFFCSR